MDKIDSSFLKTYVCGLASNGFVFSSDKNNVFMYESDHGGWRASINCAPYQHSPMIDTKDQFFSLCSALGIELEFANDRN